MLKIEESIETVEQQKPTAKKKIKKMAHVMIINFKIFKDLNLPERKLVAFSDLRCF